METSNCSRHSEAEQATWWSKELSTNLSSMRPVQDTGAPRVCNSDTNHRFTASTWTSWLPQGKTLDLVVLLMQDIEDAFEHPEKAGAVFVNLTAAYDTVWHRGLTRKLLQLVSDKAMVRLIMQLMANRSFVLKTNHRQISRRWRLKSGVPQGCVLSPLLFNVYIYNIPATTSKKYGYVDDLAMLRRHRHWEKILLDLEGAMSTLASYLHHWHLKLSVPKIVASIFRLHSRVAKPEHTILVVERKPAYQPTPVRLERMLTFRQHLHTCQCGLSLCPSWVLRPSAHTYHVDVAINETLRTITGCLWHQPLRSPLPQ